MFTTFRGGQSGAWRVMRLAAVRGAGCRRRRRCRSSTRRSRCRSCPRRPLAARRRRQPCALYRARREGTAHRRPGRARPPEATCAALIPIRKSAAWWELTQEERRQIFEDKSHHIAGSLKYLPAIARQLYHCRDLGEPFDFLTWFEYDLPMPLFEELVGCCARRRSGPMSSARWTSGWSGNGWMRGSDRARMLRSAKRCAADPGPTEQRRWSGSAEQRCTRTASGTR